MKRRNIISSVMIVCPTSLKYQWKKEIERFTDSSVTVVEGAASARRELYSEPTFYKIVSYHTLANDIKALGLLTTDFLIMDEVQRLKNWNTQIARAPDASTPTTAQSSREHRWKTGPKSCIR